jgi:site-specific recombinase XerC
MNSLGGIVLSRASRSTGPWCFDTDSRFEQKNLAPSTINVRLPTARRLAYEASDCGLLSPELAAGIRRVKGAKRLGTRIGNWLTADQCRSLLRAPRETLRGKRDRAILAVLIGCGLRRAELVGLHAEDLQIREEHWVVADLIGKGKHIRTVPMPSWVKQAVDVWVQAAGISTGFIFRSASRNIIPPYRTLFLGRNAHHWGRRRGSARGCVGGTGGKTGRAGRRRRNVVPIVAQE